MGHTNTYFVKTQQKYRQKLNIREYETYTHIIMGGKGPFMGSKYGRKPLEPPLVKKKHFVKKWWRVVIQPKYRSTMGFTKRVKLGWIWHEITPCGEYWGETWGNMGWNKGWIWGEIDPAWILKSIFNFFMYFMFLNEFLRIWKPSYFLIALPWTKSHSMQFRWTWKTISIGSNRDGVVLWTEPHRWNNVFNWILRDGEIWRHN